MCERGISTTNEAKGGEIQRYSGILSSIEGIEKNSNDEEQCHRYFPFVCEELVDAEGREGAPLRLAAPVLSRGFFAADVASLDDARGAPSFMTIFA